MKTIAGISLFFILSVSLFCEEKCLKEYPVYENEVVYDFELMFDGQQDMPEISGSYEYSMGISEMEKTFLTECETLLPDGSFEGKWYLVDDEGTVIRKNSVYFNYLTEILTYNNELYLDNWGNRSLLYKGNDDRFYIYTRWINIIRMIKFFDDTMYVYIIDDGRWVLDPIHENGKYYFLKK